MRFVLARISDNQHASEIASAVDVLQAIQWVVKSWDEVSVETIRNCFAKCGITGETSGGNDEVDKDFVELFSELTKEMVDIDDQLTPEGYANFDSVEYTSVPEIEIDDVDWRS